jgi:adenylate cyclase class 2
MQIEFEAKYPKINKDDIRTKLKDLGATLVFAEQKFIRMTFDTPELREKNAWVRLRDEGDKITMTFKIVENAASAAGMKEVGFEISDMEAAKSFLEQLGLTHKGYEENLREEWRLDGVTFEIDTWPLIDPYLEIEAPSEDIVKSYFDKLGLDYSKAYFGSSDILYRKLYGIEILGRKQLTFEDKE